MPKLDLRIFTEPQQGATYDQQLSVARLAEAAGYDGFFRSDHYLHMGDGDGRPGPTDAWITLAALARETSTIRLGTLVSPATFRLPGPLAVMAAQVDHMSGGRLEVGLGAGWFEAEHQAFGVRFPEARERFDRFEEQLEILTHLWANKGVTTFIGKYYKVIENPALSVPLQDSLPLIIGGHGRHRTPFLAAKFASEFNLAFRSVRQTQEAFERVRLACQLSGRTLKLSAGQIVCVGRTDEELNRRSRAIGRSLGELRDQGLAGSPAEVVDKMGQFADIGTERMYLQVLDLDDLAQVELIASDVLSQL